MQTHTASHVDLDVMRYICQPSHAPDPPLRLSALVILLAGGNCGEVRVSLPPLPLTLGPLRSICASPPLSFLGDDPPCLPTNPVLLWCSTGETPSGASSQVA